MHPESEFESFARLPSAVPVLVLGLLLYALLRDPARRSWLAASAFLFAGGVALPVAILAALLAGTFMSPSDLRASARKPVDVEIIAHRWWWEMRYRGPGPNYLVIGATQLHLPVGREVVVALRSFDGAHSFRVPQIAERIDVVPGAEKRVVLKVQAPGRMRGECVELCGPQHEHMILDVVAQPPEEYEAWLEAQRAPAAEPAGGPELRGRNLFMSADCELCHTVRGTPAHGRGGPDLTHLASRSRIAGGLLENRAGSLEAWVGGTHALKDGARMPKPRQFKPEELRELVAYLQSLE